MKRVRKITLEDVYGGADDDEEEFKGLVCNILSQWTQFSAMRLGCVNTVQITYRVTAYRVNLDIG